MKATASEKGFRGMFIEERTVTEKRRFRRIRFAEAVHYQIKETNHFGGCLASDLSEGGMRINFNDFVPVHTEFLLQAKLEDKPHILDLRGRVKWLQKIPYSDRYHVGLEFTRVDPIVREELRSYIRSRPY